MNRSPIVALVELFDEGHHPMYAAGYWTALRDLGCETILVGPPSLADLATAAWFPAACEIPSAARVSWDPVATGILDGLGPSEASTMLWHSLKHALFGRNVDLVFLLSLDSFVRESTPTSAVEALPWRFSGLWFKPPAARPLSLREAAKRIAKRGRLFQPLQSEMCDPVLVLGEETEIGYLRAYTRHDVLSAPEFSTYGRSNTMSPTVARLLGQIGTRRAVALVGSLEPRKGVREFIRAAAANKDPEWVYVLAGRLYRDHFDKRTLKTIEELANQDPPRLILHDGWLEARELNDVVAAVDLMFLCYNNWRFSTNFLCKTSAFRVPVLAYRSGYIGRMVQRFGLGVCVRNESEAMTVLLRPGLAARLEVLRRSEQFQQGCESYLSLNSLSGVAAALSVLVSGGGTLTATEATTT